MRPFTYVRASNASDAVRASGPDTRYLAGGTNLLDLMKEGVERPLALVDITRLALTHIGLDHDGPAGAALSIGGLAKNSDTATHPDVWRHFPLLSQAILAGASAQIRNMATIGGNLNQRTRCPYFYEPALPCNKRSPGTGCSAHDGINRSHAIFGWSDACVATHPSDMAVALAALDAKVNLLSARGESRPLALADYHRLPGDEPQYDNHLAPGEIITSVEIPANNLADHSCYLKVRERTSYAFALVSVAAALEIRDGAVAGSLCRGGCRRNSRSKTAAAQSLQGRARAAPDRARAPDGVGRHRSARALGQMATGWSHERADADLKVTGSAKYTADFAVPGMAYAVLVTSTIAKGRIAQLDATAAETADGVIRVISHANATALHRPRDVFDNTVKQPANPAEETTNTASRVLPLESDQIHYWGQIVAVVVAESFEAAQAGAELVAIRYEAETPACSFRDGLATARKPTSYVGEPIIVIDGDPEGALGRAARRSDRTYATPLMNHHPMEMQSTLAEWRGDELFVEEPSRYVQGVKRNLAHLFGTADDRVHVRAKFVGGAFGSKGAVRPHVAVAARCARGRSDARSSSC